jgi:Mce-associated membrane protein
MPIETTERRPSPVPRAKADDEAAARPTWTRRGRIITTVLALLVLLAAAGTWHLATRPEPADIRPAMSQQGDYTPGSIPGELSVDAVRVAVEQVPRILSYDYRTLDKHAHTVAGSMTPAFRDTFTDTLRRAVVPMAGKNKAITKAVVRGAGVSRITDDESRATLLLFVDQMLVSTHGKKAGQPRIGQERVTVELAQVDGQWLIDDIKPF